MNNAQEQEKNAAAADLPLYGTKDFDPSSSLSAFLPTAISENRNF